MNTLLLLILAVIPSLILLYFILYMDRNEKEPLGMVIKMILLGALSVAPCIIMENIMNLLPIYTGGKLLRAALISFVRVAWVEELCKLGVVLLFAWNSKHFTEENDGIVYVGASAIGFAMLENIFYVLSYGTWVGILRAVTAIPMHCFTGILMGYFVGRAKFSSTPKERNINILKGFLLAFFLHGLYDTLILTRTNAALLIFPMVVILIIFGIRFMKKGRALSIKRTLFSKDQPSNIIVQPELLIHTAPKNQLWKIIISRTLLSISVVFWILIIIGLAVSLEEFKSRIFDAILGGIILSFFPIIIGVILEISYRRKKKFFKQLQEKYPELFTPDAIIETIPPGQRWKIVFSTTLFTISGLFWALIILGFFAQFDKYGSRWFDVLFSGSVFSFIPIYIAVLARTSYQEKKRLFNILKRTRSDRKIPPEALAVIPPGQLWKAVISRILLPTIGLLWAIIFFGILKGLGYNWDNVILGATLISITPIIAGISLEVSYRRKKNKHWEIIQNTSPLKPETNDPRTPVKTNDELHDYCQKLKKTRQQEGLEQRNRVEKKIYFI